MNDAVRYPKFLCTMFVMNSLYMEINVNSPMLGPKPTYQLKKKLGAKKK